MSRGISNVFDRFGQGEAVRRNDAEIAFDIDEGARVELLGIDDRAVDVGEDLETAADAHVVAVARDAVGDHAGPVRFLGKRLDFDFFLDLPIREQAHGATSFKK